jgi:hypothetical protein
MPLLFVGDYLYDYDECPTDLEQLGQRFRENDDRVVLNLEGALKGRAPVHLEEPTYQSETFAPVLKRLNTVAVSLANNHTMDGGPDGLSRLIGALDEQQIIHFGAGADLAAATKLRTLSEAGTRIGLLAFGWRMEECVAATSRRPGVAPLENKLILKAIRQNRPLVDCLIVCFHWGYEYELRPLPVHRQLAHNAIEAGADLIIGHHPHVIQATETFRGKQIYYSLGNFYFGSRREVFTTLNPTAEEHSQLGLGVRLSFGVGLETQLVFFRYQSRRTELCEDGPPLEDISAITLAAYNPYFQSRRQTDWRPTLYSGALQRPLNRARLLWFALRTRAIAFLKTVGLFRWMRRLRGKLRFA